MVPRPIWLQTVIARVCVFFFALTAIAFLLFLLGNLQEFLESTQIALLRTAAISSFLYIICSIYFIGIAIVQAFRRGIVGWYRVVLIILGLVIALGVMLFTNFLQSWIEQVR